VARGPLRLLIATPIYPPRPGGAANYFSLLVDRLAARPEIGRIVVLTRASRGLPRRARGPRGLIVRILPSGAGATGRMRRAAIAAATHAAILAAAWRWRADLVHVHTTLSVRGLGLLARVTGPLVADMRDLAARDDDVSVESYARCAAVIAASENIAAFLAARGVAPEKIHRIPIPLEIPRGRSPAEIAAMRRALGVPPTAPYVGFAGDIAAGKGVLELLEAFGTFAAAHPEFHLVLAGPSRPGEVAAEEVKRVAGARVHHVGALSHGDTLGLIQGAALIVLPSRSEGLPRVCLEAMALGRKVLCPPGVPELERACPEFVLPDTKPATIAARMEAVLQSDATPTYDFTPHDPDRVADQVCRLYAAVQRS